MDQLNKIKLEDDPMANSWENDKMVITTQFADLANKLIQSGITSSDDAINELFTIYPQFRKDEIFQKLFPIIFNIQRCKNKLN